MVTEFVRNFFDFNEFIIVLKVSEKNYNSKDKC